MYPTDEDRLVNVMELARATERDVDDGPWMSPTSKEEEAMEPSFLDKCLEQRQGER